MGAYMSGNDLFITGATNTLASITTDINDTAIIESLGSGVYEFKCTTARTLRIRPGGELTIGDVGDFSVSETLNLSSTANSNSRFRVDDGAQLNMYGNTKLDFCSTPTYYSYYIYIYGGLHVEGDDTYKPILQNQRWIGFRKENDDDDDIYMYKCIVGSTSYPSTWDAFGIKIHGPELFTRTNVTLDNITFDQTYGQNKNTTAINFELASRGAERYRFTNCTFDNLYVAMDNETGFGAISDSTFGNISSSYIKTTRSAPNYGDQPYSTYGNADEKLYGQTYVVLSGNTFSNEGYNRKLYSYYGSRTLLVDNNFQELSSNVIYSYWAAVINIWTGNTFSATDYISLQSGGVVNLVSGFKWTVEDEAGSPLEDVNISARQSEGKERFLFETGPNGKPYDVLNLGVAFLTHTQQHGGNTLLDVAYQTTFSSSTNSTYHTVEFSKAGYRTISKKYEVKEVGETTETITMRRLDSYSSVC